MIGAIAAVRGAAIAATGAGAGTGGCSARKPLVLSQETVLSFALNAPVTMEYPEVAREAAQGRADDCSYSPPERRSSDGQADDS